MAIRTDVALDIAIVDMAPMASWTVTDDKSIYLIQNGRATYVTRRLEPINCMSKEIHKYNPSSGYFCLDQLTASEMNSGGMPTPFFVASCSTPFRLASYLD